MKAIALANRLCRDLKVGKLQEVSSDTRQEILDAINGALQRMNAVSPTGSKTVPISIPVSAPLQVSFFATNGSYDFDGYSFSADQCYRTIRIDGDHIDNSVVGEVSLFHPYGGETGPVSATLYCDAVAIPEPYSELVGDPKIVETHTKLVNTMVDPLRRKQVARPSYYWVEDNARNQNPPAPLVMRFDSLPDRSYRMECKAILASARVTFSDILAPGIDVPLRDEHIESYLIPIARSIMTTSESWRNPESISRTVAFGENAERGYELLVPRTTSTPNARVQIKRGF